MYFPVFILVAICIAITHACYDDSHLSRRSENGSVAPHFGYTGLEGPLNWHGLDKQGNALCATGKMQTPINLDSDITKEPGMRYVMRIPPGEIGFENKGHTVEGSHINNATLAFGGRSYNLAQFHFHTPSEHRINDEYFPLEVHFVHKTENGSLAVVGFVIEIGQRSDPFLRTVLEKVSEIREVDQTTSISFVDFRSVTRSLAMNQVYRYQGSLTTPPCTEGVEWIVSDAPLYLDYRLFNQVKRLLKFNSRYTQTAPGENNLLANAATSIKSRRRMSV